VARVNISNEIPMLERVTHSLPSIATDHEYIHEGIFFQCSLKFTLSAAGTRIIVLTTPADKYIHYRNERLATSGDKLTIELYEGPTVTAETGTPVTCYNHNRLSTITADMAVLVAPTVTVDGTLLSTAFIGGGTGTGSSRSGAELTDGNEWVLKRSTKYMLKITNGSSADNIVCVNPVWYEEGSA